MGQYPLQIEETDFSLASYQSLIDAHCEEIDACKARQQTAFEAERQRWVESGQANFVIEEAEEEEQEQLVLEDGQALVESHVAGNVWQALVKPGDSVKAGQVIMVLEAMKMELEVVASESGVVDLVCADKGAQVSAGQPLVIINTQAA
ncbi:acetyl-CoA carboxylase biotin carboxyl carrier protein subunit [Vibrio olivae]